MAAWSRDDTAHLEVIENRPGVSWLVPYLTDVHERLDVRLVVDSGSPAKDVTRALQAARVPVTEMSTGDYAAACGRFTTAVLDRALVVQPDPVLDLAVTAAERRNIGDRWVWDRRRAIDLSPLTAATVAAWPALAPTHDPMLI